MNHVLSPKQHYAEHVIGTARYRMTNMEMDVFYEYRYIMHTYVERETYFKE